MQIEILILNNSNAKIYYGLVYVISKCILYRMDVLWRGVPFKIVLGA